MAQKKEEVAAPQGAHPIVEESKPEAAAPTDDLEAKKRELIAKINAMSSVDQLDDVMAQKPAKAEVEVPVASPPLEMKIKEQKVLKEESSKVGNMQLQIEVSSDLVQTKDQHVKVPKEKSEAKTSEKKADQPKHSAFSGAKLT